MGPWVLINARWYYACRKGYPVVMQNSKVSAMDGINGRDSQIQGRRKANRTRRLKPASPTFDNSSSFRDTQNTLPMLGHDPLSDAHRHRVASSAIT